jgi:hypothetical protein
MMDGGSESRWPGGAKSRFVSEKTKPDWAIEMARVLEERYAACEKLIVVCDKLNTHTKRAFNEAFEPEHAWSLVRRIESCYTPKHGSWLNIAENELSSLTRRCVSGRRFPDVPTLRDETSAWSADVNATQRGVGWQMKSTMVERSWSRAARQLSCDKAPGQIRGRQPSSIDQSIGAINEACRSPAPHSCRPRPVLGRDGDAVDAP